MGKRLGPDVKCRTMMSENAHMICYVFWIVLENSSAFN